MPWRLFAAVWSYELASWFAFLGVVSGLEAAAGARLTGAYFVLYNGVQLPAAALFAPWLDRIERGRGVRIALGLPLIPLIFALLFPGLGSGLLLGAAFALSDYLVFTLVPAAIPLLLPPERVSRANALWQTGSGVIFALAPAVAGFFLERYGEGSAFALAGALLLLAALVARALSVGRPEGDRERRGWREVLVWPLALRAGVSVFLVALGGGVVNAALPVLTGGGAGYGLVLSALGAGGLAATLVFTRVPLGRPLLLAGVGLLLHAASDLALALGRGLSLYLPAAVAKGLANAAYTLGLDTALQLGLPSRVLARAFSLGWALGNLGQMTGAGAFGFLAPALGVGPLLLASALLSLFAALPLIGDLRAAPSPRSPGRRGGRGS